MKHRTSKPEHIAYRHIKTKRNPFITASFRLDGEDYEYLKSRNIDVSPMVRDYLSDVVRKLKRDEG